jgi:hypothetical protein
LQIRVIAADVQLAVRIVDDAGRLQQNLVQRRRVAERERVDRLAVEEVFAAADVRRELVAGAVELADDADGAERFVVGRGWRLRLRVSRFGRRNARVGLRRLGVGMSPRREQGGGNAEGQDVRSHGGFP